MHKPLKILSLGLLVLSAGGVVADTATTAGTTRSPYTGYSDRTIKALSAEQIDDYIAGRGMGLALAAELNHYPGPRHVLELADELQLNPQQQRETQQLFEQMQARAIGLGKQIVDREGELDQLFAGQSIDAATLSAKLAAIAQLQGELRNVHLSAHLKMRELLTRHQIHSYARLRGYGDGGHRHGTHH